MKLKNIILTIILSIFYPFSLLQKVEKDKISFISLESKVLAHDFELINDGLVKSDHYKLEYILFEYSSSLKNQFAYVLACIRQLFLINRSHLVLLDFNNFVVSKFKRKKGVKVLQVWHATGAIKQFGNTVKRDYKIQNYDYAIVNSEFFVDTFSRAFNVNKDNVKITGIPETDKLFSAKYIEESITDVYQKYPLLKDKKIITYAPTFRGRIGTGFHEIEIDLDFVQKSLGNDYAIIYKPHPLITQSKYQNNSNIIYMQHESIKKVFAITDILVSDYSAIIFDYMVTQKPLIAYVPDLADYRLTPGIIFDYEAEFPGAIVKTDQDLVNEISMIDYDEEKHSKLYDKVFQYRDGRSLQRVIELIDDIMGEKK